MTGSANASKDRADVDQRTGGMFFRIMQHGKVCTVDASSNCSRWAVMFKISVHDVQYIRESVAGRLFMTFSAWEVAGFSPIAVKGGPTV